MHIKLTALILEAHIAALDRSKKFGEILSQSLKNNYNIDTTFPDRDSAAIFNFYYPNNEQQQPTQQEQSTSEEPMTIVEAIPHVQRSESTIDQDSKGKRRISEENEYSTILIDDKHNIPIKLYRNHTDTTIIPLEPTLNWYKDELSKPKDRGIKFTIQDLNSQTILEYIKNDRIKFIRPKINVISHEQFIALPRHQTIVTTSKKHKQTIDLK
jgi:hypothetical protein